MCELANQPDTIVIMSITSTSIANMVFRINKINFVDEYARQLIKIQAHLFIKINDYKQNSLARLLNIHRPHNPYTASQYIPTHPTLKIQKKNTHIRGNSRGQKAGDPLNDLFCHKIRVFAFEYTFLH